MEREAWRIVGDIFWGEESHTRVHDACEEAGITPPLMKALLTLQPGEAKPMRALAAEWRCDASWVTGLVDQLEERGYVERQVLPADRRVKMVQITELGLKVRERLLDRLSEPPSGFAALESAEVRTLRALLRKVAAHTG